MQEQIQDGGNCAGHEVTKMLLSKGFHFLQRVTTQKLEVFLSKLNYAVKL